MEENNNQNINRTIINSLNQLPEYKLQKEEIGKEFQYNGVAKL